MSLNVLNGISRIRDRPLLTSHAVEPMIQKLIHVRLCHDTRAIQHYLGHKNIQHTVGYTELAPDRFNNFGAD